MEGTKPKSIFDIPKPIPEEPPKPKRRRKRSKTPKKKRPKVARAGGVEVSQVKGSSKSQITLKQKGGLTQEITIYTGDKPNPRVGRGRTNANQPNWNMKPAKFKKSRGLRDDRVYLQPPKREYFGNRYKSALDKIKIEQKVKEAGLIKNKETEEAKAKADREVREVRDRAERERRQLERRERANEATIVELQKEKAGIVASHNVSQRNQSRATILGGDVGELNKLIARRGYEAIRRLVVKGEITDVSTILQLDLDAGQIDRLTDILEGERADYPRGARLVYLTGKGVPQEGVVLGETDKFVKMRKNDGGEVRVPKTNIQTSQKVAEARSASADPSVRAGRSLPTGADFGSPRPAGSSADERPAFRRDDPARRKPRKTAAEQKQEERRARTGFVEEVEQQFTESSEEAERPAKSPSPETKLRKTIGAIREGLQPLPRVTPTLETALEEAEAQSPPATGTTIDELVGGGAEETFATAVESDISSGQSGEDEPRPEPEPAGGAGLTLELESGAESLGEGVEGERELEPWEIEAQRQFQEAGRQRGLGGAILGRELSPESQAIQRGRRFIQQTGGFAPKQTAEEFFRSITPRQKAIEERRKQREASQERVAELLRQSDRVSSRTTEFLQRTEPQPEPAFPEADPDELEQFQAEGRGSGTETSTSESGQDVEYTQQDIDVDFGSSGSEQLSVDEALVLDKRDSTARREDGNLYYQGKLITYRKVRRAIDEVFKDNAGSRRVALSRLENARKKQKPFETKNEPLLKALGVSSAYQPEVSGSDDL